MRAAVGTETTSDTRSDIGEDRENRQTTQPTKLHKGWRQTHHHYAS